MFWGVGLERRWLEEAFNVKDFNSPCCCLFFFFNKYVVLFKLNNKESMKLKKKNKAAQFTEVRAWMVTA